MKENLRKKPNENYKNLVENNESNEVPGNINEVKNYELLMEKLEIEAFNDSNERIDSGNTITYDVGVLQTTSLALTSEDDLNNKLSNVTCRNNIFGKIHTTKEESSIENNINVSEKILKMAPEASDESIGNNEKVDDNSKLITNICSTLNPEDFVIEYKDYESELQMQDIMRLIQAELSEPYSIYTYRYFIYNWPKLCFLAAHNNEYVGAIVCKLDMHLNVIKRGYIAMLAVKKEYRKMKIGTNLVQRAIEAMVADDADEVVLETEMKNIPALRLYENLGFVRDKRLFRYYLNGVDALRLKLWFR